MKYKDGDFLKMNLLDRYKFTQIPIIISSFLLGTPQNFSSVQKSMFIIREKLLEMGFDFLKFTARDSFSFYLRIGYKNIEKQYIYDFYENKNKLMEIER